MPIRHRIYLLVLPLTVLGCLLIALVGIEARNPVLEYLAIGFFLGSMFGHATLAAAWAALGPGWLLVRLPMSLVWVAGVIGAMLINVALHDGPDDELAVIGLGLLVQWLIVQLPLWALVLFFGVRLRHRSDESATFDPKERQFGIRQLLLFTALIAVLLGIGRVLVTTLGKYFELGQEGPIFIFLSVAAIAMTLPVLLAALLRRWAVLATMGMLLLVGLGTAAEAPLLTQFHRGPGPDIWHFFWINAFASLWIVIISLVVQLSGYRLSTSSGV